MPCRSDTDSIGFASDTAITDVDIVMARGEIFTSEIAQRNVVVAGCVANERSKTVGRIANQRIDTGSGISKTGRVVEQRRPTSGGVAVAAGVMIERVEAYGCVIQPGREAEKRVFP